MDCIKFTVNQENVNVIFFAMSVGTIYIQFQIDFPLNVFANCFFKKRILPIRDVDFVNIRNGG